MLICANTIDVVGWPGFLVLAFLFILEINGTTEQKHEFIDQYILGKQMPIYWTTVVFGTLFAIIVVAQQAYWRKRMRKIQAELTRLADWKSDHQQAEIDTTLQHTKGRK